MLFCIRDLAIRELCYSHEQLARKYIILISLATVTNPKMIARFLIAFLIHTVHHQQVESQPNAIEVARNELDVKVGFLGASFAKNIVDIFYDKAESAEAAENYPLLALLTEMARMHVSQHRREQNALSVANEIFDKYFVRSHLEMHDSLPKTKSLADLIVCRVIQNACESEFEAEKNRRKRIYSLFREHDQVTGVRELAREYSARARDKKTRAIKSKERTEGALRKYQSDISDDDVFSDQASNTMRCVDELIALTRLSRPRGSRPMDIDGSPIMSDVIKIERKLVGKVNRPSNFAVERIPMEEVAAYEQAQLRSHLESILVLINLKQSELDQILSRNIDEILFKQRQVLDKSAKNYYPMLALSAELAEAEALLYTFQKRMLRVVDGVVRRYFLDRTSALNETLLENSHLLSALLLRADVCALEAGILRLEDQRKRWYLFLKAYDLDRDMVALARKFYVDLNQLQHRLAQINVETISMIKRYKYEVSFVLSEPHLSNTAKQVDELLRESIQRDYTAMMRESSRTEVELDYLFEKYIGANVVKAIRSTEREAVGRVEQLDQDSIQSVDPQLVMALEREILSL